MKAAWDKNSGFLVLTAVSDDERRMFKEMGSAGGSVIFREWGHSSSRGPDEFHLRREETFIPDDNT